MGDRVESRGVSQLHKLTRGQLGTVRSVRDMGARGTGYRVDWDDGVDRGSVGGSHLVLVPKPAAKAVRPA